MPASPAVSVPPGTAYDAIVIGSGIGGLTTAVILAKLYQKRVLVLDQHYQLGGLTHAFSRQQSFRWDVGLHYVGDMAPGQTGRQVMDYLTAGQVAWQAMPDPFEKFVYPDGTFAVSNHEARYRDDLIGQFPAEAVALRRYFRDIRWAALGAMVPNLVADLLPPWLNPLAQGLLWPWRRLAEQTTRQYLERHFRSPALRALLTSQWADYGLPPGASAFGVHSVIVLHYLRGGWYPVGGGGAIAPPMLSTIQAAGGLALGQRRVTEILIQEGRAVGVKVQPTHLPEAPPEDYYAPAIISAAGAFNTYTRLIPAPYAAAYRQQVLQFAKGPSALILHLGLKDSPQALGFRGENHWIYNGYDHDALYQTQTARLDSLPQFCYLSFPSLKDPTATHPTAEVITLVDYAAFAPWQGTTWRHRGADYQALKARLTDQLLAFVEQRYPGFRQQVAYAELSTPLSVEHFEGSDHGALYGIPVYPERLRQRWIAARTPIPQLYLTGADSGLFGIMGAMMGGIKTAAVVQGGLPAYFKIMGAILGPPPKPPGASHPAARRQPSSPPV